MIERTKLSCWHLKIAFIAFVACLDKYSRVCDQVNLEVKYVPKYF